MKRMARIIKITARPTPIPIHVPVSDGRDEYETLYYYMP
jgi:hypothetical protein